MSFASSKMDSNFGSSFTVTVLDSPGASWIFSHATRRLGGSLAAAGRPAYTWAISTPARLPVLRTVNDTESIVAFSPE